MAANALFDSSHVVEGCRVPIGVSSGKPVTFTGIDAGNTPFGKCHSGAEASIGAFMRSNAGVLLVIGSLCFTGGFCQLGGRVRRFGRARGSRGAAEVAELDACMWSAAILRNAKTEELF